MVSKEAWAMVGGYHHVRHGWEDYDFWARLAEIGLAVNGCPKYWRNIAYTQTSMMKTSNYSRYELSRTAPRLLLATPVGCAG